MVTTTEMKSSDRIVPEADFSSANQWVVESGREYVVIDGMESFDPFFLNIVSAGEQWFFCSSDGAPCAGRRSPESAYWPGIPPRAPRAGMLEHSIPWRPESS